MTVKYARQVNNQAAVERKERGVRREKDEKRGKRRRRGGKVRHAFHSPVQPPGTNTSCNMNTKCIVSLLLDVYGDKDTNIL